MRRPLRPAAVLTLAVIVTASCGQTAEPGTAPTSPRPTAVSPTSASSTGTSSTSATPTTAATSASTTTTSPPATSPTASTTKATTVSPKPSPKPSASGLTSLKGNTRNAIAWAPVANPGNVTIEGSVPSARAWSTSKVLVVAAYLDTVVGGDPTRIPAKERGWIRAALSASDGDAVVAIRGEIPGSPGAAIERVLRDIGDTTTQAPDTSQGTMQWSVRQQLRLMAALANGRVVSPRASAFLLDQMHPIIAHRWGLGTIGASSFKGGWLRADTETRQMGIVDGYAVAIITAGDGPAVVQTDGDSAHVRQLNHLAALLATRLR